MNVSLLLKRLELNSSVNSLIQTFKTAAIMKTVNQKRSPKDLNCHFLRIINFSKRFFQFFEGHMTCGQKIF